MFVRDRVLLICYAINHVSEQGRSMRVVWSISTLIFLDGSDMCVFVRCIFVAHFFNWHMIAVGIGVHKRM